MNICTISQGSVAIWLRSSGGSRNCQGEVGGQANAEHGPITAVCMGAEQWGRGVDVIRDLAESFLSIFT